MSFQKYARSSQEKTSSIFKHNFYERLDPMSPLLSILTLVTAFLGVGSLFFPTIPEVVHLIVALAVLTQMLIYISLKKSVERRDGK